MNEFPQYFGYDIQGNDTDIFPLLTIGSSHQWGAYEWWSETGGSGGSLDTFFNPIINKWREFLLLSTTNLRATLWDGAARIARATAQ